MYCLKTTIIYLSPEVSMHSLQLLITTPS